MSKTPRSTKWLTLSCAINASHGEAVWKVAGKHLCDSCTREVDAARAGRRT